MVYSTYHLAETIAFSLPLFISVAVAVLHREKRHDDNKPQISSGPFPCIDKDGTPRVPPKDPPWFTDDKCHMSLCTGALVITKSLCFDKGTSCPEGSYLNVPTKPSSPADCCVCKPYESLRKRFFTGKSNGLKKTVPGDRLPASKPERKK